MVLIGSSKRQKRANHWKDVQSRVTTHEGEPLSGKKGRDYQQRWSKKCLGKDLSKPSNVDENMVERFEKTGK